VTKLELSHYGAKDFQPESPFWFKNGTDHTPIPLFADNVKQFSYGPPPTTVSLPVEQQQRVIAGGLKMPVVGTVLLFSVDRDFCAVHIQHHSLG
jgi:hypothetical protein